MRSTWKPAIVSTSLLGCVVACLVAIVWSSPPSIQAEGNSAQELQALFEAAKAAVSAGDVASAETHYIDAIELGLRQATQLSLSEGKVDEAAAYLDSALKLKPDNTETQAKAAAVRLRKGEVHKPKDLQPRVSSGAVGKPPAAETETKAAKQYRASLGQVLGSCYNDLGVMRAKDSRFPEAAEFFKQAAAWSPHLAGLDRNWGLASFRAEMYKDAVPPLERHLKAHPDDSISRQVLGLSYSMLENYAKVVEVYRPFLEDPPDDPGLLLAWGTALVRTRQSDAERIFQRLLQQNNDNASVHLMLGQAYAQQEEYPNALAEMKTSLQLDPRLADAHYYMGIVYLETSDFDSAGREFRAELQLQPTHTLATYHLGYALLSQGHPKESVPLFREVIKEQPQYELAHFELGRALLEQEEIDGAIQSLEVAKKLVPDHDAVYYLLSRAYRRAGRTQEAAQALAAYQKLREDYRLKKLKSTETETP
jgi:tetratricopeptide (TPR) repeat protein